jgi:Beta-lactamase class C and other penicillin binding proteins
VSSFFVAFLCLSSGVWGASVSAASPDPEEIAAAIGGKVARSSLLELAPGLAVVVVEDGKIVYIDGFGLADVDSGRPIVPNRTRFRIGSVTKVFTALEALKLAEQGKLRLDDDISRFMPEFRHEPPILVEYLLTHSAGFDETILGFSPPSPGGAWLYDYLREYRPPLNREPGKLSQYSNYGVALAGAVEAQAAGVSYETCISRDILGPLGMLSSGFFPTADTAESHEQQGGRFVKVPYLAFCDTPDGGLEATCADMGLFMITLLEGFDGRYQAFSSELCRELLRPRFRNPGAPTAMALCMQEVKRDGLRYFEHQGGIPGGQVSYMALFPERRTGIFAAANSLSAAAAQVVDAFVSLLSQQNDGHSPVGALPLPSSAVAAYVGTYRSNQYAHLSFQKLFTLLEEDQVKVSRGGDGRLLFESTVTFDRAGKTGLVHVDGDRFERADGGGPVWFIRDSSGRPCAVSTTTPICRFERVGFLDNAATGRLWGLSCLVLFLILACYGIGARFFKKRKIPSQTAIVAPAVMRGASWACLANLAAAVGVLATAVLALNGSRVPVGVMLVALTIVSTASLAFVPLAALATIRRQGRTVDRLCLVMVALVSCAWILFVLKYNLYGLRL